MVVHERSRSALLVAVLSVVAPVVAETKPLSIRPSQQWDGKDGPWSSFRIQVGTPPQQVRVLPAHDQSSTWLVLGQACGNDAQGCGNERGRLYSYDNSSTWQETGFYDLEPWLERQVGQDGPGYFGWDDITLGWEGDDMPTLKNQSVVGITTTDFWLGSLSLNPRPVNFTNYNNPIPSLMQNLRNRTKDPIPSLSWSYTAGAYNLAPKVYGSLVLGGYDTTHYEPNSLTFPFGGDQSFDFQVAIQSITTSLTDDSLLDSGIIAYISTLVPDIWLPASVCAKFEEAFGLTWDNETELYLMNSSLHSTLLEQDPSVRFTVGPEVSGGAVTINMPYWNFYQTAQPALTNASKPMMYFPLKRAANDTQYVLGRTFLQSAHLSADYERSTFNLSQALYPSSSTAQNIVAVLPPLQETTPGAGNPGDPGNLGTDGNSSGSNSDSSLSSGAIAGIAVGLVVLAGMIAAIAFVIYRRRKAKPKKHELEDTDVMHDPLPQEVSGEQLKVEMGGGLSHEVPGDMDPKTELAAYDHQKPVEADGNPGHIYEMQGDSGPVEMSGENTFQKVPSSYLT
ncbi:acid protease [Bimuria novae-zelandiae CBS 107.79]|uniref:Acid protease n=1 Tax=Bimuria novae-zelandiae CBS 107.79 TaxID=1447943 RepID=A0A6A5VA66_9PLEO|nr:acid protease [Bimuria novae-zelandiae CBS 107.79]